MTSYTHQAVERALAGGWKPGLIEDHKYLCNCEGSTDCAARDYIKYAGNDFSKMLMDKYFWQALGKAENWGGYNHLASEMKLLDWKDYWRRFTDHLIAGQDIESFFAELLTKK